MSYIVCSNTSDDNERRLGISSPASFMNNFRSPLEIEPNSEVAVESIKINRRDEFDIVADDEFFVYFGVSWKHGFNEVCVFWVCVFCVVFLVDDEYFVFVDGFC